VAITPPSDIVLGVALAADPQAYQVAAQRLTRLGNGPPVDFSTLITQAIESAPETPGSSETPSAGAAASGDPALPPGTLPARTRQSAKATDAFGQLEAFVLQTFIQSMLPKNAPAVFGKGTAGDVWKSMLAEKMGAELSRSGQVGIAKRLSAAHASAMGGASAQALLSQSPVAANAALSSGFAGKASRVPPALSGMLPFLRQRLNDAGAPSSTVAPIDPAERS
jgi:hypothetical protein